MISKMADKASAISLLICSHESWVKVTYDWSTALCLVALCLSLCRTRFHYSQSLDFPKSPTSDVARLAASWPKKLAPLAKKPPCLRLCLCRPSFHLLTHVLVLMLMLMRLWKPGLSREENENGEKTTLGLMSKKATLHVQHTFAIKTKTESGNCLCIRVV